MEKAEKGFTKNDADIKLLQDIKCDQVEFDKNMQRINEHMAQEDLTMKRLEDHCIALDNYLDKYQPVRMQDMINDHLDASLYGNPRKAHTLYQSQTISKLYRELLVDSGNSINIQKVIEQITKKARDTIEEEERQKRRKAAT